MFALLLVAGVTAAISALTLRLRPASPEAPAFFIALLGIAASLSFDLGDPDVRAWLHANRKAVAMALAASQLSLLLTLSWHVMRRPTPRAFGCFVVGFVWVMGLVVMVSASPVLGPIG